MEHSVDDNLRCSDFEEDAVRKPPKQGATHRGIDELIGFRMAPDERDRRADCREELAGKVGILRVIPRVRGIKIKLRLRGEAKSPYLRRSSLARTSPQDFAADGLRVCARRRLASSLRCASVTGMASGVAARLSQIPSINSNRSSTLSPRACLSTVLMFAFSAGSRQAARIISVRIATIRRPPSRRRRADARSALRGLLSIPLAGRCLPFQRSVPGRHVPL
jgi:hypothetical protein